MQTVRITVTRRREYRAGDTFDVFGDNGTGTLDFDTPLLDRREPFWPEAVPIEGHLQDGHLMSRHFDAVDPDGHCEGLHVFDAHLHPAAPIDVETRSYMFGAFRHAVRTYDAFGNARVDVPPAVTTVVNSRPTPPRDFAKYTYLAGSDQMTFTFSASDSLIGA